MLDYECHWQLSREIIFVIWLNKNSSNPLCECGWGLGAFLRWWPLSTMWAGPVIFYGQHRGCLNNPIFSNLGLGAACWAHFMCHHELWPTSVSHPFSFLNSSWGLTRGKHYQKITIAIFRFVLQNFTVPGYFPYILFYRYLFSLLSPGWFVIAVCDFISIRELVKYLESLKTDVELSSPMTSQLKGYPHFFVFFFNIFFY